MKTVSQAIKNVKSTINFAANDFLYDVINLLEDSELTSDDVVDQYDLYNELDYDGSLHGLIDGAIDIYSYDLRKWSLDNYNFIEDAIEEGLCEGVSDFHKLIQAGQYVANREEMESCIEIVWDAIEDELEDE